MEQTRNPAWGELIGEDKWFPCHRAQLDILQSTARFVAAIAGSGGGKSACGALWLMQRISETPKGKFLIVTPTFHVWRQATRDAWERTIAGTALQCDYMPGTMEYRLPTGGVVWVRSADNPISLQGVVARAVWLDEGGKVNNEAWRTILQRVGYHQGRVLVTTTPYDFGWLHREFYTQWKSGNPDYFVKQFPSIANPTYPKEEYSRARDTLPAHHFEMLYNGQFCRAAGLVYPDLEECIEEVSHLPQGRLVMGVDFGFNDPFCALGGVLDSDDVLHLCFERYKRNLTLEEHLKFLPKECFYYADSARPDSIKAMRKAGFKIKPCRKGTGSIAEGINLVVQRMRRGALKIVKGTCPNLLAEAETYAYQNKDESNYGDTPIGENDHALDSARYLVASLDRRRKIEI